MVLKSQIKYTPELLIEAPRRTDAVPNNLGTHAMYTVSNYSIETNTGSKEIRILDIETGKSKLFSDDEKIEDAQWLVNNLLIWKRKGDGGTSELWVGNGVSEEKNAYFLGKIEADISAIRTVLLPKGNIALTFAAAVSEDGKLLNVAIMKKPASTAREWETIRVRFWSTYHEPYGSTLWYTTLEKNPQGSKWTLGKAPVDALTDTPYLFPWVAGPSFGPGGGYQISSSGILLPIVDDINYDAAQKFMPEYLYIQLNTFTESKPPSPIILQPKDRELGGAGSAAFSPDGKKGAILRQKHNKGHEAEFLSVYVFNTDDPKELHEVQILNEAHEDWDVSASEVLFSESGEILYILAESRARLILWSVDLISSKGGKGYEPVVAKPLTRTGSVSSIHLIKGRSVTTPAPLWVNSTSVFDSSKYSIVYPSSGHDVVVSSATENGALLGISPTQLSEFSFKGAGDYQVQCFILRPSNFQADKKYPCMLLVHGGPNSAWLDGWSYRWNSALFCEQGYIVVMPNISGSTGFGQEFARAVVGDWGGRAYVDLENCWKYVEENLKYADTDKAVILGASYGGYMMNWVAGKPLAKKFKAIVNHDGIFSLSNLLGGDLVGGIGDSMGGDLWDNQKKWDDADPSRFTAGWTQPMLVIHSDNDYRCPIEGGLAAFKICKMKGIEARLLNFPNETHFVLDRANSLYWNYTVIGWCNKYAGVEDGIKLQPPVSECHIRGRKTLAIRPARKQA